MTPNYLFTPDEALFHACLHSSHF